MNPDESYKDPAFPAMAMDILSNVLSRADNPGDLGSYLTEEVRNLIGARCVLLIQCLYTEAVTEHRVVGVNPLRRREWAESPAGNRLCELVQCVPAEQLWRGEEPSEVAGLLRREGFELSMVFPLHAGEFREGAMFVLGLPDEEHISSVRSLLGNLSAIVALVLRNAFFYEKQEQLIVERTKELRDSNERLALELAERKKAEEALRESKEELREAQRVGRVGNWNWDTETDHITCSEAYCDIYGFDPLQPLTGYLEYLKAYTPESAARLDAAVKRIMQTGEPYELDLELARTDGACHWIAARGETRRDANGQIVGLCGTTQNITERKRAEEQLARLNAKLEQRISKRTALLLRKTVELEQANERLKEVDRLKSSFLASMSHELRTPLNAVIGFSTVLLDEWSGPVNDEQKQNLASILSSGRHLLNMITDILDVTQIEAGTITPVIEEFDLYDMLAEAENKVTAVMQEKGLELHSELTHQLMRTDRRRLLQCVLNILSNAAKFTDKGSVTLEARIVASSGETPAEEMVEIAVTDTGIGIGAEDQARIFQPFVRIDIPGRTIVPGTGLGLFLTRKIATELLKGDLLVSSEYGKGSRFSLRIPVRLS